MGGGALLLLVTPWLVHAIVSLDGLLIARALLGPTAGRARARAATRSTEQRDLAVASASDDRRQIERDLHDGAQARHLPAVDLGRAAQPSSRRTLPRRRRRARHERA